MPLTLGFSANSWSVERSRHSSKLSEKEREKEREERERERRESERESEITSVHIYRNTVTCNSYSLFDFLEDSHCKVDTVVNRLKQVWRLPYSRISTHTRISSVLEIEKL